jgi:hypothetical protein
MAGIASSCSSGSDKDNGGFHVSVLIFKMRNREDNREGSGSFSTHRREKLYFRY